MNQFDLTIQDASWKISCSCTQYQSTSWFSLQGTFPIRSLQKSYRNGQPGINHKNLCNIEPANLLGKPTVQMLLFGTCMHTYILKMSLVRFRHLSNILCSMIATR